MSDRLRPDHYSSLDAVLETAWQLLTRGFRDRKSDFRIAQVATVDAAGRPSIRSVVLRGFDADARVLRFHTDYRTAKVGVIRDRPQICVHFYDTREKVQLRLDCHARLHHQDAVCSSAWSALQPMSRACYAQDQAPGTIAAAPELATSPAGDQACDAFENFAVVTARIDTLEWLYLSAAGHRRARFAWDAGGDTATWLAP